jgi:hypothetical protein
VKSTVRENQKFWTNQGISILKPLLKNLERILSISRPAESKAKMFRLMLIALKTLN